MSIIFQYFFDFEKFVQYTLEDTDFLKNEPWNANESAQSFLHFTGMIDLGW